MSPPRTLPTRRQVLIQAEENPYRLICEPLGSEPNVQNVHSPPALLCSDEAVYRTTAVGLWGGGGYIYIYINIYRRCAESTINTAINAALFGRLPKQAIKR